MNKNIQNIFIHNIELFNLVDKAIVYFREEHYDKALGFAAQAVNVLKTVTDAVVTDRDYFRIVQTESVTEMLEGIIETKRNKDYILLADLFEMQLLPFIGNVQELILKKENFLAFDQCEYNEAIKALRTKLYEGAADFATGTDADELDRVNMDALLDAELDPGKLLNEGYRVEFTECGLMTIAATDEAGRSFYLHSNNRVQMEAFLLAKSWAECMAETYIIYGIGMGYHICELMRLRPDAKFEIYEADMNILKLACAFSEMGEILGDDEVTIVYDPELKLMKKRLECTGTEEAVCIHYPSMRNIKDITAREVPKKYIPWADLIEEC